MRSRLLALAVVGGLILVVLALWRVGPVPAVELEAALTGIGPRTPVVVRVSEPRRGLSDFRVELEQEGKIFPLASESHRARPFWAFWGPREGSAELNLEVGSETLAALRQGEATLRVVAERAGTWLRHPDPAIEEVILPVRLTPPTLQLVSNAVHVTQGGSGLVVYRVGEGATEDGVIAGDWWFPGYPLPGGGVGERFSLFAAPYDHPDGSRIRLRVADDLGNEAQLAFLSTYAARPPRDAQIQLSEAFMDRVVPAILARTPEIEAGETLLESYLRINGDLRQRNARTLIELSRSSQSEFLWTRPFRQLGNSQVMASFADRRTYMLDGKAVDQQDHLGFDLASYRRAPVDSANSGIVVLAEYFGIYGNTVVVDHGYGLMSLYSHLSSIGVEKGQRVEVGESLGRTGETGLAGGDHLHFTMMIHGAAVNPIEWWDPAWVRNRITEQLIP